MNLFCIGLTCIALAGVTPALAAPDPSEQRIAALISQLGHAEFKTREAASTELKAIGKPALTALKANEKHDDPEVRTRVADLLQALEPAAANPPASQPWPGRGAVIQFGGGMVAVNNPQFLNRQLQRFGIAVQDDDKGSQVTDVIDESQAAKLGLKKGDRLTTINDQAVTGLREITLQLRRVKETDPLSIVVERNGKPVTLKRPSPEKEQ